MAKQIEVFIAFDKEDGALLRELEKHLKPLETQELITVWNASKIVGGMDWQQEVNKHLALLQEVDWTYSIFGGLAPLPANGRPVATWKDRNAAFLNVVTGIRQIVTTLNASAESNEPSSSVHSAESSGGKESAAPKPPTNLTPFRRHVLEEKLKELQRTWQQRNDRKQYIQQALDIESDPTHVFRYKQQIRQENEELVQLENEIGQIEQQLQ